MKSEKQCIATTLLVEMGIMKKLKKELSFNNKSVE